MPTIPARRSVKLTIMHVSLTYLSCHMMLARCYCCLFFHHPATTEIYTYLRTLSLHDALPIWRCSPATPAASSACSPARRPAPASCRARKQTDRMVSTILRAPSRIRPPSSRRSEEHTSELQSLMRSSYAVFCLKKKTFKNSAKHLKCQPYLRADL